MDYRRENIPEFTEALLSQSLCGFAFLNKKMVWSFPNDKFLETVSWSFEALTQSTLSDLLLDPHRLASVDNLFAGKSKQANFESAVKTENGDEKTCLWSIIPIRDKAGTVTGMCCAVQDQYQKRQFEALYQDISNNIPGALFQYIAHQDGSDSIFHMSPGCEQIWEIKAAEAESDVTRLWSMVVEEDLVDLAKSVQQSAKTLDFWQHEYRIVTPSGKMKWLAAQGTPRVLENGDIFWNSIIIDVTGERQSQEALEQFFEQPMNMNAIVSADGVFRRVNDMWETVLGYTKDEIEGKPFIDFVHPDDVKVTEAESDKVTEDHQGSQRFQNRYRHKDGSYRYLSWFSMLSAQNDTIYAAASDITEEREKQIKLRQAAAVFDSTADGVIITDVDGNILDTNQAFHNITGYNNSDVIGKTIRVLESDKNSEAFLKLIDSLVEKRGKWEGELEVKCRDGNERVCSFVMTSMLGADAGISGYVHVFSDVTDLKLHEAHLDQLAHHDSLTGLPNRLLFGSRLDDSVAYAERAGESLAILFIDLDRFKHINDSMGHASGDSVLQEVARRLQGTVRQTDLLARISGDEFVILLHGIDEPWQAGRAAESILESFNKPITVQGVDLRLTTSVGISLYPKDAATPSELMAHADAAMYRAKQEGRNNFLFHAEEYSKEAFEYVNLANALQLAIANDQFHLVYQPQFNLDDHSLNGLEALIRWEHPEKGMIAPDRFIPIAEQSGLIRKIGSWVLQQACQQAKALLDNGIEFGRIAINVSSAQFYLDSFVDEVTQVLAQTNLPPKYIEIEVTETFLMQHLSKALPLLDRLRMLGVTIAIDDFGTGYSSLSYLKRLPVDKLKIDRSFVQDLPAAKEDVAIVESIVSLAKALELSVTAEGIETAEQAEFFKVRSVLGQGYHLCRPNRIEALSEILNS